MPSRLKQRRLRRLKSDVAWWRDEANNWKEIALEHADTIALLRGQIIRVPMPIIVPPAIIEELDVKHANGTK